MESYDVVIAGAARLVLAMAEPLARRGFSVLGLRAQPREIGVALGAHLGGSMARRPAPSGPLPDHSEAIPIRPASRSAPRNAQATVEWGGPVGCSLDSPPLAAPPSAPGGRGGESRPATRCGQAHRAACAAHTRHDLREGAVPAVRSTPPANPRRCWPARRRYEASHAGRRRLRGGAVGAPFPQDEAMIRSRCAPAANPGRFPEAAPASGWRGRHPARHRGQPRGASYGPQERALAGELAAPVLDSMPADPQPSRPPERLTADACW
jgi:hypothetical protein